MSTFDALQIYDEFYSRILRYVLGRVGNAEVARDITAEVFLKMVKHRLRFKLTKAPVSAWLYRIAGNEVSTFYRRAKYRPLQLEAAIEGAGGLPLSLRGDLQRELAEAQAKVDQNDAYCRIRTHLCRLPAKYQEVIVLHYLEEQSVPAIAALLGKREGTVKSLISRGIAKLREVASHDDRATLPEEHRIEERVREEVGA